MDPKLTIIEDGVPSEENINRWRDWVKTESRPHAYKTVDNIFDCAILGARRAIDIEDEVNRRLKSKLRQIANQIGKNDGR